MKILLLGASSYVGARLYFDLRHKYDVVGTYDHNQLSKDFVQLDITETDAVHSLIAKLKPDAIVHAANNANARWCETNPEEAKALNETSTQVIVDAANTVSARLIYISSFAAIQPINVYGSTKRASEEVAKQATKGWIILRPSLIIGYSPNTANDRPFNRLLKNVDEGTKAEYDTSWKFQPTWVGHISEVIDGVLKQGVTGQTIPIAVDGLKSRYDFAKDILEPFGVTVSPTDAGDTSPQFHEDLSMLKQLYLPAYSYSTIIEKIVQEIRERNKFTI